jgi:hypothetical protein
MSSLGINNRRLGISLMANGKERKFANLLQTMEGAT